MTSTEIASPGLVRESRTDERIIRRGAGRMRRYAPRARMLILPTALVLGLGLAACGGGKSTGSTAASPSSSPSASASTRASASASTSASASASASSSSTPTPTPSPSSAAPSSPPAETPEPTETKPPEDTASTAATPDSSGIDPNAVKNGDLSKDQYGEVSLGETVNVVDGVSISLGQPRIEELTGGPGEVAGSGIVVPVTLTNNSGTEISLSGFTTSASYGEGDGTPANEVPSASKRVPAKLAAGESVSVDRAFVVPAEGRKNVKVVVDLGAAYHSAVFRGAMG